jgi:hypothetical protein
MLWSLFSGDIHQFSAKEIGDIVAKQFFDVQKALFWVNVHTYVVYSSTFFQNIGPRTEKVKALLHFRNVSGFLESILRLLLLQLHQLALTLIKKLHKGNLVDWCSSIQTMPGREDSSLIPPGLFNMYVLMCTYICLFRQWNILRK